ncbi:MAG: PadR family transcriptional regulator [Thermaerobacter sp.]|nr:PadR family transcriptional regulator [Thermaerobacter sp.]
MPRQPFIRMMILNYLLQNQEITGYGFIKYCRANGVLASPGNIYPHLKQLDDERVIAYRVEGKKKVYTLTDTGKRELARAGVSRVPEFLKTVFFRNMSLASTIDWSDPSDVGKLLTSVLEAKAFLETYVQQLVQNPT